MAFIGLSWTEATKEETWSTVAMENRCVYTLELLLGTIIVEHDQKWRGPGEETQGQTAASRLEASAN